MRNSLTRDYTITLKQWTVHIVYSMAEWSEFGFATKFSEIFCQFITNRFTWNFTCKVEKVIHLFRNLVESFFVVFDSLAPVLSNHQEVSPIFFAHSVHAARYQMSIVIDIQIYTDWTENAQNGIFTLAFLSHSLARFTSGMQICGGTLKAGLKLLKWSELRNSTRKKNCCKCREKGRWRELKSEYKSHCQSLFCGRMNSRIISNWNVRDAQSEREETPHEPF